MTLTSYALLFTPTLFAFGSHLETKAIDIVRTHIFIMLQHKALDWDNRRTASSEAQLIERAGHRKHLPVRGAGHLSDPARIRWFPCLYCLPAAPCSPAHIACLLGHPFHQNFIDLKAYCHFLAYFFSPEWLEVALAQSVRLQLEYRDQSNKLKSQMSAWPFTPVHTKNKHGSLEACLPFPLLAYTWGEQQQEALSISLTDNPDPAGLHVTCIAEP